MVLSASSFVAALAAANTVAAETVLGAVIFTRHGDRTPKMFTPYALTRLGLQQNFRSASFYRATYVEDGAPKKIWNISADEALPEQLFVSTPDEPTLFSTTSAFMQGLYPPLTGSDATGELLANGTTITAPFGLNYVQLHGEDAETTDTIWLKGDVSCPTYTKASNSFKSSTVYKERTDATRAFYATFKPLLDGIFADADLTYDKAYSIFDYLNVHYVHNTTVHEALTEDQLFQLRTLADSHEWGLVYNESQPERSLPARSWIAKVHAQLNATVNSAKAPKLSVLTGSYNTFQNWFGLSGVHKLNPNFLGLPDYASTLVFEAVTNATVTSTLPPLEDISVRFLFRNGSAPDAPLTAWPLFETGKELLSWSEWSEHISGIQIASPAAWCKECGATSTEKPFCPVAAASAPMQFPTKSGDLSLAAAGAIGAATTLGVVGLLAALLMLLGLRLSRRRPAAQPIQVSKIVDDKSSGQASV
jgi:prostatic aicd phosphatase